MKPEIEKRGVLIADAGGTNTQCALIYNDQVFTFSVVPFHSSSQNIDALIEESKSYLVDYIPPAIVHFYGAGVLPDTSHSILLENRFKIAFSTNNVYLHSDLLGAARSLYGQSCGWVGILGTGANVGYFDGKEVIRRIAPLGYILGDEGSGYALGKRFLKDVYRDKVPVSVLALISKENIPPESWLINEVYQNYRAKSLLSSFSQLISEKRDHTYFRDLVFKEMESHADEFLFSMTEKTEIRYVGSVAYSFKEILEKVLDKRGITLSKCIKSPLEGLIAYHKLEEFI